MTVSRGLRRPKNVPFEQRWVAADRGHSSECHEWQWNVSNTGYGRHGTSGKMWLAHRYSYTTARGEIPEGLSIDHLCRNRLCVNPEHLEAVTLAENTRRELAAVPPRRGPRCGHEQEAGWKNCRICARARRAAYRDKLEAKFGVRKLAGGFSGNSQATHRGEPGDGEG